MLVDNCISRALLFIAPPIFCYVLDQIRKEPGTTRIDIHHFLHGYNPQNAPHALEGSGTLRSYDVEHSSSSKAASIVLAAPQSSNQQGDGGAGQFCETALSCGLQIRILVCIHFVELTIINPLFITGITSNTHSAATSAGSANLNKTMDDADMLRGRTAGTTGMGSRSSSMNKLNAGYTSNYNAKNSELKRIWQSVLRECHRSDPERCGQVSRTVFISALEKSDLERVSLH